MNNYQQFRVDRNYKKVMKLDINENTKFFLKCMDEEIIKQRAMANEFPEFVLGVKESKFEEKYQNLNQWIEISITYNCSQNSQSIIEYAKGKSNNEQLKICSQLFKICAWMQQNFESAHGNIKPSNIIIDGEKVLLTDFGSQRTFYKNYCSDISRVDEKNKRYRDCLFYCCSKILEIYKQNSDNDLRNIDLNQLNFLQNPLQAISADIYSIGIIILDILCPVEKQNFDDVTQFYGVNKQNLNMKLEEVQQKIQNKFFVECLEAFLSENLSSVNLYQMYERLQLSIPNIFVSQSLNQLNRNVDFNDQNDLYIDVSNMRLQHISKVYTYDFRFSSLKQVVQQSGLLNKQNHGEKETIVYSNGSIIDFNQYQQESNFQQSFKQTKTWRQQEISQLFEAFVKIPRDQQINHLFNFNQIIKMKKQQLLEYKENLEKLYFLQTKEKISYFNKNIISDNKQKVLNAYMQVEWREGALNMIGLKVYNEIHDALVFYLTYDEFIKHEQEISISDDTKLERKNLHSAIQNYKISGIIQEQYLKYFPISILENGNDEKIIKAYVQKSQQKIQSGIEWFDFNEILMQKYFSYKFEQFQSSLEEKFLFRSKIAFDQLTLEQQMQYKNIIQQQISNINNNTIYEIGQFEIHEMYTDYDPFKQEERKYDHNLLKIEQQINNIEIISKIVKIFCEQNVKLIMKFSFDYKVYFRKLKQKVLENHQQGYKNKQEPCYYSGETIDNIPNGFGYAIFNKNTLLVGLFRNNKFISGWSIVQKSRFFVQYIILSIGNFQNGWLYGEGSEKEFKVIESKANKFIFFQLQLKRQGIFQEGSLSNGTFIEYEPYQNRIYNVLNFQKIVQPRQSNLNVQVDQV